MHVDLHIHSTHSDGWSSPSDAIDAAVFAGAEIVSLTDHDCTSGTVEALERAASLGTRFVPGVEITTERLSYQCHVLGHGIDPNSPSLGHLLHMSECVWKELTEIMFDLVASHVSPPPLAPKPGIPTPHAIARALLEERQLAEQQLGVLLHKAIVAVPRSVESYIPSLPDAVDVIHGAGGLAVLAHPGLIEDGELLNRALEIVDGVEIYTNRHPVPNKILRTAEDLGLHVSAGSDYHGYRNEPYRYPGGDMPRAYLDALGISVSS